MTPSAERRYRQALLLGAATWLDRAEPLPLAFWDRLHSVVAVYVDSKREFDRARGDGRLAGMMAEARKMAGPV